MDENAGIQRSLPTRDKSLPFLINANSFISNDVHEFTAPRTLAFHTRIVIVQLTPKTLPSRRETKVAALPNSNLQEQTHAGNNNLLNVQLDLLVGGA